MRTEIACVLCLAALSGCAEGTATLSSASAAPAAAASPATASAASAASAGAFYSCPMHPEVHSAGPGQCPSCGMNLEQYSGPSATAVPSTTASAAPGDPPGHRIALKAPPLEKGKRTEVELSLFDPEGRQLAETDFKIAHERRIHLLIIDESLRDYHHEHPVPSEDGKTLRFGFTPRNVGPYRVFADVLPVATRRHLYLVADLPGSGPGEPIAEREVVMKTEVDGYAFELKLGSAPEQGQVLNGDLFVRDAAGAEVTNLEPVMGAYAHLVGFFDDRVTVEHIHPMGAEPTRSTDRGKGALKFRVTPNKSGMLRLFAQVKLEGKERFAPFTLQVAPKP